MGKLVIEIDDDVLANAIADALEAADKDDKSKAGGKGRGGSAKTGGKGRGAKEEKITVEDLEEAAEGLDKDDIKTILADFSATTLKRVKAADRAEVLEAIEIYLDGDDDGGDEGERTPEDAQELYEEAKEVDKAETAALIKTFDLTARTFKKGVAQMDEDELNDLCLGLDEIIES